MPPSGVVDVCSCFQLDFTVIHDKGFKYSEELLTTAAGPFMSVLGKLNIPRVQRELFASVEPSSSSPQFSAWHIQSLEQQLLANHVKL